MKFSFAAFLYSLRNLAGSDFFKKLNKKQLDIEARKVKFGPYFTTFLVSEMI